MIHRILHFTLLITVCCVLHRYASQDIHRWEFVLQTIQHSLLINFFLHDNINRQRMTEHTRWDTNPCVSRNAPPEYISWLPLQGSPKRESPTRCCQCNHPDGSHPASLQQTGNTPIFIKNNTHSGCCCYCIDSSRHLHIYTGPSSSFSCHENNPKRRSRAKYCERRRSCSSKEAAVYDGATTPPSQQPLFLLSSPSNKRKTLTFSLAQAMTKRRLSKFIFKIQNQYLHKERIVVINFRKVINNKLVAINQPLLFY